MREEGEKMSKIIDKINEKKQELHKKKIEKEIEKFEREISQEKLQKDRIESEIMKIELEKERLNNLSEKELFTEAIIAIRGLYLRFSELRIVYQTSMTELNC